jgi:hypothetical protein
VHRSLREQRQRKNVLDRQHVYDEIRLGNVGKRCGLDNLDHSEGHHRDRHQS